MNVCPKPIRLWTQRIRDTNAVKQTQGITQVSARVQLPGALEQGVGGADNRHRLTTRLGQRTRVGWHIDKPGQGGRGTEKHRRGDRNQTDARRDPRPRPPPCGRDRIARNAPCRKSFPLQRQIEPGSLELLHASEQHQRLVTGRALIDGAGQQVARAFNLSRLVRVQSTMQELLRFALALRDRLACAIDVRAGAVVIAIEKDDARPDVDRLFVFPGEIVIQTRNEKFFDARGALGGG